MVKLDDVRGGEATEPEEGRHIPDLPKGATEEILLVLEGEQQEGVPFTEGTFNTEDNKSSFEMQSLSPGASEVETEVTEEELALIAAELIAQGKIQAQFAAEWEEAEADGKEVANYTGSVGLLRGGTRQIAKLILAGLVWLTASDWGTAKAHADPISLSANAPNPDAGSARVEKKELTGEEIIRLERTERRHVSLDDFVKTKDCRSEAAARLWVEHQKIERNNTESKQQNPNAKLEPDVIDVVWNGEGKIRASCKFCVFKIETSIQDENGSIVPVTKYFLVSTSPDSVTRRPHNLFFSAYAGLNEDRAIRAAEVLASKL